MMTTKARNDPWTTLSPQGGEWVGRRAVVGHPLATFWMIHPDGSPALLVKQVPLDSLPAELPKLRGLGIAVREEPDQTAAVSLHLRVPEDRDVFLRLCEDVLAYSGESDDRGASALRLFSRLRRWQSLFGLAKGNELSDEEMRGLVGELALLHGPLTGKLGLESALTAWVAPMRHAQDFVLDGYAIEVKSRVAGARNQVRISSLDQLEAQSGGLGLVVVELLPASEADGGKSLNDFVIGLLDEAEACGSQVFEDAQRKLAEWGYVASRNYDRHRFVIHSISAFAVTDGFPRFTRSETDPRIIDGSYVLGLQALGSFAVDLAGMIENR
ncbi:PD-(D/E)XK motif protein [Luteimonas sp. MJ174]|uniref:PD-(D/E)XK motif protein n=1 Tax=Luteimonas sp. MJ174 TaxID=3129237 RepID=UPI0031BA54DE